MTVIASSGRRTLGPRSRARAEAWPASGIAPVQATVGADDDLADGAALPPVTDAMVERALASWFRQERPKPLALYLPAVVGAMRGVLAAALAAEPRRQALVAARREAPRP